MLSIVATPIGNLGDITLRAIETLKTCDAIVCEDTRVTGNLLKQLGLPKKELISFHSHTYPQKLDAILERLGKGQHLALVSDAGTPGISDPGYALVAAVVQSQIEHCHPERSRRATMLTMTHDNTAATTPESSLRATLQPTTYNLTPVPGPSAFLAALSASGLTINQFLYLGFLPIKKGRQTLLRSLTAEERTIVFYESVHRIERTLRELAEVFVDLPNVASTIMKKGEFVVVVGPL